MTPRTPAIVCIPSGDRAFRAAVEVVLELTQLTTPATVEATLRKVYPSATVRERELSDELVSTWYAYRDGAFLATGVPNWPDEPGTAWARIGPDGIIRDANKVLIEMFAGPGGSLVGRSVQDFIAPGTEAISDRQLQALADGGENRSIGRGRTHDGGEIYVEYVVRVIDGDMHTWVRRLTMGGSEREPD